jgi:hypothetical protein
MTVIALVRRREEGASGWTMEERRKLEALYQRWASRGEAGSRAEVVTEHGDPLFLLIGPQPGCECLLSIARLGERYVVEDGNGVVLAEMRSLIELDGLVPRLRLRHARSMLLARIALAWCAVREFVAERSEPMVGEMVEFVEIAEAVTHIVPRVALFA